MCLVHILANTLVSLDMVLTETYTDNNNYQLNYVYTPGDEISWLQC
jgi:hypothetical protein